MGEEGGTTAVKDIVLHIMPLFDAIHANLHLCLLSEFETSLVQFT